VARTGLKSQAACQLNSIVRPERVVVHKARGKVEQRVVDNLFYELRLHVLVKSV
jgi:hypothetical protein